MSVASILLSVVALIFTGLGVLLVPIPIAGALVAFAAPAIALTGVVLGGRAMSERRKAGQSSDVALVGVVLSSLAFFPALLCALTCGVCNALCSTAGPIDVQRQFDVQTSTRFGSDASAPLPSLQSQPRGPDAGVPAAPSRGGLPPPPLPPGPRP